MFHGFSMGLYSFDRYFRDQGFSQLAGVDEVGRGCLAGPVFAAAVILPSDCKLSGLDDSKKVKPVDRVRLDAEIRSRAMAFSVAMVSVEEIDRINILRASLKAMHLAIQGLTMAPQLTLVDGHMKFSEDLPQVAVIEGDAKSASIAAASIIAKVARDIFMSEQEAHYPHFSFSAHKGYGTPDHLSQLKQHGPCPLHRRSFEPVRQICVEFSAE